jgi:hypothetical protein
MSHPRVRSCGDRKGKPSAALFAASVTDAGMKTAVR